MDITWRALIVITGNLFTLQARHIITDGTGTDLWQPETGSREEFFRCRGLPCDEYSRIFTKLHSIEEQLKREEGISTDLGDPVDGCIFYTEEQADVLLHKVQHNRRPHQRERTRYARKVHNFDKEPLKIWPTEITYVFDGTHDEKEKDAIRKAFGVWELSTCVTFIENNIETSNNISQEYILLTKETYGCYSFVGKTGKKSQIINLSSPCLYQPGTAIHEIGHTLGLWHEHQRVDRDSWITINYDNIGYYVSQFYTQDTVSYGIPYDYSSVMQYPSYAGTRNGDETIVAKDPLYQNSMGQRVELSYFDRKMINYAYCNASCEGRPLINCKNGGYQDPRNCTECICPDGFSGTLCKDVAASINAECGGMITINQSEEVQIMSPGYISPGFYNDYIECSWRVETVSESNIKLQFVDNFGIHKYNGQVCTHWLEVKFGAEMELPGPRFCGQELPETSLISARNELVLIFKANDNVSSTRLKKGFKVNLSTSLKEEPSKTEIRWSEWSRCNRECQCGSCSERTRHALCNGKRCEGNRAKIQREKCNRICTRDDVRPIYPGSSYMFPCPRCCGVYKANRDDNTCQ